MAEQDKELGTQPMAETEDQPEQQAVTGEIYGGAI